MTDSPAEKPIASATAETVSAQTAELPKQLAESRLQIDEVDGRQIVRAVAQDLRGRLTEDNKRVALAFFSGCMAMLFFVKFRGMPSAAQLDAAKEIAITIGGPAITSGGVLGAFWKFSKR